MAGDELGYKSVPLKENNEDQAEPQPSKTPPQGLGTRHIQALLLFISLATGYSMRAQLSVSMVAMTSDSTLQMWYPNVSRECLFPDTNNSEINDVNNETGIVAEDIDGGEECRNAREKFRGWTIYRIYNWNKATQEMILFSFFVGYTGMMIPTGMLAQKFGGKIPIMVALGANAVLSILTPWVPIFSGWLGVCVCRVLQGATQAAFYPSIHSMLAKWAPLSERGRLSSYVYTGSPFGTVVAFQISGLFAGSSGLGWPATFWFCGAASLTCFVLLGWLGAATPHEHPSITSEELKYIMGDGSSDTKKRHTPWKQLLTSPPVWGLITSHVGSAMGYLFVLTQIPLYMNKILGVDIKKNGVYSSLPYIAMYMTTILFGNLADWAVNRKILSVANIRRVGNSIGMVVSSMFLVGFSFVTSTLMGVILLVMCLATHSGIHIGFHINSIDLAPNFAGPIMAVGNMLANLACLIVPVMVSNIIGDDTTNQHKWQIMFFIMAAIQSATNIVFVVFVRGSVQPWNFHDEHRYEQRKDNKLMLKQGNSQDYIAKK
ncbi:putative inorganic phosphate cotransporter [Pectinophora gossypiella]|uniref:putative inorganic phosphate cotransporter n=1 Tax=Pectinophora gossypiella TaxID=13191 RepID=UPI00214F593F|nr:putative inorganic phosphate cotransporter [Pectinophora gossypiella]